MTLIMSIRAVRFAGCLAGLLLAANLTYGQEPQLSNTAPQPLDDITVRNSVADHRVLSYQPIREADILWEKRLWRVIDVREKINHPFIAPESPLFNIFTEAAQKGELTLYSTENDHFTKPLSAAEIDRKLHKIDTILVANVENGTEDVQIVSSDINWENVKRYRVKESWYFDTRTGSLNVRILGIAPLIEIMDEKGDFKFEQPLFWVYYPGARNLLAQHKVVTPGGNYSTTLSWEDWFEMRHFASMITKENNTLDLRIQDYAVGLDAVMKSKNIQDELFNREHDLWSW
jgi:gliding motility associated protien GldN